MLKHAGTLCAAALIAAAAFTAPAQAQRHGFHAGKSGVSIAGPRTVGSRVAVPRIAGSRVHSGAWRGGWQGRYAHGGYRYRYGGYWPYAGLAIGALAAWPYYGGYYDGYYPYEDYSYGGYVDEGYVEPGYGGDVAYCIQRFRSYNPATGTYRGYDGLNHACP